MKRIAALCLLALSSAFAQSKNASWAVTATGATAKAFSDSTYHTLSVVVVSPSVCTIRLEGTIDGSTWFDLSGSQTCTSSAMFHVDGKPIAYVRANLLTYSGDAQGATVKITYWGTN